MSAAREGICHRVRWLRKSDRPLLSEVARDFIQGGCYEVFLRPHESLGCLSEQPAERKTVLGPCRSPTGGEGAPTPCPESTLCFPAEVIIDSPCAHNPTDLQGREQTEPVCFIDTTIYFLAHEPPIDSQT